MIVAETIGLALFGYGIWFGVRGIGMLFGTNREWWRPTSRNKRYPYPAAGALLGIFFMLLGGRFVLHYAWEQAPILGYVGGGLFLVVLAIGVIQPRPLHPRWYGLLEDRLGKKAIPRLRSAALQMETEEWIEITASETLFGEWVNRTIPWQERQGRGYRKSG